jgi:hypothetical protein
MLPGWASALIYLIGFVVLFLVTQVGLQILVGAASVLAKGPIDLTRLQNPRYVQSLMGAERLGVPLWCSVFFFFGWAYLLVFLIYTGLLSRWLERKSLLDLGLRWNPRVFQDFLTGIALAGVFFVSVVGVGIAGGWYSVQFSSGLPGAVLIAVIGTAILLPFAAVEELGMRGYVLQAAARSGGPLVGLAVSAVAFAFLHSLNAGFWQHPLAIPGLILAGVYLASAYFITGNLWLAIFLHMGWNLMEGPVFGLGVSGNEVPATIIHTHAGGTDVWTGGAFGPEAGLPLCLLLLVHIAALWALRPWLAPKRLPLAPTVEGEPPAAGRAPKPLG